jgi:hypothetical protein
MDAVTLIVPFYRNCRMLERQVAEWVKYPPAVTIVVVDDGSPEPALPMLEPLARWNRLDDCHASLRLYRIMVDIPWNREGARNLGAREASTRWLVHVDIDHVMPAAAMAALLDLPLDPGSWYRFPRYRCGRADETRKKDKLPAGERFGRIHPHIDSYLMPRDLYWRIGGYDEDFSGVLGGGSDFLRRAEAVAPVRMLPDPVCLHVHTRDSVADASDFSLSRDTSAGKAIGRRKAAAGPRRGPTRTLRFPWERQL